jgi:aromatase
VVHADAEALFELAAKVEDWPRILPHYRRVHVLRVLGDDRRLVEMAARREVVAGLGLPVWWRSIQRIDRAARRIEFEHVAGITHGMSVEWLLAPRADGTLDVAIRHVFEPRWRVPHWLVEAIVGDYFVNSIAQRTLSCLALQARKAG